MIWWTLSLISISTIIFYKLFPFVFSLVLSGSSFLSVFSNNAFRISAEISVFWSILNTTALIFLATFLAWSLRKNRALLNFLIFIPWAVPVYLTVMVWRFTIYGLNGESLISHLGLPTDIISDPFSAYIWSVILSVWLDLPMITLSILHSIEDIPNEIIEAARIDGATKAEIFTNIVIPKLSPILEGWFLLYVVRYVHSFTIPFLLTSGGVTKPEWITQFGALGNLTTLGILNYKIFEGYDMNQMLSFSVATYIFLSAMISVWIFRKRESLRRIALLIFFSLWMFISKDLFSIAAIVLAFLPSRVALISALLLLPISKFKSFPIYFLITFLLFVGERKVIRLGKISSISSALKIFIILLLAAAGIITFSSLFMVAFTDYPDSLKVSTINFSSMRDVLSDGYGRNILNSLTLAIPVMILSPILSFPLAYSISRKKLDWMLQMFLVLRTVSGIHILSMIFVMYAKMKLINSIFPVSLIVMSNVIPQIVVFMKGYIDSIPKEYEEAAILEGGKSAAKRILMRVAVPQLSVGSLIGFMAGWNAFLAPLMLLFNDSLYPASVKLYSYIGNLTDLYPKWNLFGAGAILNLGVSLTMFIVIKTLSGMLK